MAAAASSDEFKSPDKPYVVLVAGSRNINNFPLVCNILDREFLILRNRYANLMIISGGARGVDLIAKFYAQKNKIPFKEFPVTSTEWATFGRGAGPKRNSKMVEESDYLIAITTGSPGTQDTITKMMAMGKMHRVYRMEG